MLSDFMPFIVSGLTVGAIYGLCGTGFVITYKTSGIFNFAHPALAAAAAYLFWYLHYDDILPGPKLSWPVAAAISVLVLGPVMGLGMELLSRGLVRVTTALQILATIGLLLGIVGTLGLFHNQEGFLAYPAFLPTDTVEIGGTFVGYDQLILFGFSMVVVVVLYLFFRASRMGVSMRAVVDNPPLLDVMGTNPNSVRRIAWIIGATFAAASGVLLGPVLAQLNAFAFITLTISAFGAAAIGGFTNLPLTFLGGLLIGVVGDLSQKYTADITWLNGLRGALPFIVLYVVLVTIKPSRLAERRVAPPKPVPQSYYAPARIRIVAALIALVVFAFVPQFVGTDISIWLFGLTYMILFLSIGLLAKVSGQVSLAHTALAAIGGATLARAISDWGLPWFLALVVAGLVTVVVGMAIAIPAVRVSGVFLALATLGFGLFLQQMIYPTNLMFGSSTNGVASPRPSFASSDESYYYLVLAFVVVAAIVMTVVHYGRLGRLARALGDSPLALDTMGTTVRVTLLTVFAISAFMAGVAGALFASASQTVYLGAPMYIPFQSLQLFAVVMLIGAGSPWYGIIGAFALQIGPYYIEQWLDLSGIAPYLSLLFGVGAVSVALTKPAGFPMFVQNFLNRFRRTATTEVDLAALPERPRPVGSGLEISDLRVRYGGFVAVDSLNLHAPPGRITALIGPNGAGKTTTFNVCSGLVRPAEGRVTYDDRDITRSKPAARARRGLGRTFQRAELWPSLTVKENVALGAEAPMAGGSFAKQVIARPGEPARTGASVLDAMDITGIRDIEGRLISDLSTGEKRLVELARVIAGPFELLLLDEPSAGLDTVETERFGAILRSVVDSRGTGALLVEHDMSFVTQVCDYVYVLDFGTLIFEGTAREAMESDIVRAAYLGTEPLALVED